MIPLFHWNTPELQSYLKKIDSRGSEPDPQIEKQVASIIAAVRTQGDIAVREFTRQFDGINLPSLRIDPAEVGELAAQVDPELRHVLRLAKENIRTFHERQMEETWEIEAADGVRLGQRISPLQSVGLYVPGGTAAYPSTVLMNALPAKIAGVPRIVVTTPRHQFRRNPVIAAVLEDLGLDEVYGIGGAQAVAALAYGTETVPKVNKIVGPGNIYVATAKRQVYGVVDIDMIAGPSEVVVVAEDSIDPDFVAADLMAQAEHDANACAIAIVLSKEFALSVQNSAACLIKNLSREKIVREALENCGALIICASWDQAAEAVNAVAPEHLELLMEEPEPFAAKIHSAGAIFFGPYSCEPVGDYFAGPNHVLPTSGAARFASPLGVYDFLKRTSLIKYTQAALQKNHAYIEKFAESEGLDAHAQSARVRFKKPNW
ncbi:MAG: histidinol dehydrogenase [Acidobacteria bacterium]|nr:histidinol dehydrogenase [Acidobacteriota bacterium]MCI0720706.1 histidinol dehydrogenase [Acidobacteriota bacterium]